jgi:hypothetical protein
MIDSPIDLVKYGVLWQKVEDYEKKFESMERKIDKLEMSIEKLVSMADRSRGGFWVGMMVVSGLSSFIGFVSHYVSMK